MTAHTPRRQSVALESWIFAGRLFIQWRRYPTVPLQALLFPTILLVIYSVLVGKSMVRVTGETGLDLLIPVCAVAGAMQGSISAGLAMTHDQESGLLARLWSMPVHRASALAGTLLAEALRTWVGTVLTLALGYVLGFRFYGNVLELLGYLLVPSVIVVIYSMIVITLGLRPDGRTILAWFGTASMGMAFAAFVPAEKLPSLARPLAEYQPISAAVQSMRLLSLGADGVWLPLAVTAGWCGVLAAIFGVLGVRSYRNAAETGKTGN
ncbi:ABC transporter [Mycobacterium sp. Root265]|uniref:ABC transporter permease n=1 Tax=Mycobacterium sp. Root265 TaxID=1736504 RepID=UPI000710C444|nr:ABC transporter permease [Mycobacterium sp. Root265]KRD20442.1 ABC transporter [Mycobacterium sp. Root265]